MSGLNGREDRIDSIDADVYGERNGFNNASSPRSNNTDWANTSDMAPYSSKKISLTAREYANTSNTSIDFAQKFSQAAQGALTSSGTFKDLIGHRGSPRNSLGNEMAFDEDLQEAKAKETSEKD